MAAISAKPLPDMVCQAGAVRLVGSKVRSLGGKTAFLVSDQGLAKAGLVSKVQALLEKAGLAVVVFDQVPPNPTFSATAAGLVALGGADLDGTVVVSLGGGSSMDLAKAVALFARNEVAVADMASYCFCPSAGADGRMDRATLKPAKRAKLPALPIVAIPTTSGTASETNSSGVLMDDSAGGPSPKLIFTDPRVLAAATILDPSLTLGLPRYPTATCAMDVFTHALEALTSAAKNPYSSAIALGAIRIVATWLPRLMADLTHAEARRQMMVASHMAGAAFGQSGLGIVHAMGHPLSALLHQAHGQTLCTMLPHAMRYNLSACAPEYALVADAFGVAELGATDEANARAAIEAVARLSIDVGTARSIGAMGGSERDIAELVRQTLLDLTLLVTPRQPTAEDLAAMFRAALHDPVLYPGSAPAPAPARL